MRALLVLLSTALVVFALDHLVKRWVVSGIPLGGEVWPRSLVTIHHIRNRGAAFGLFPGLNVVFLVVAVGVSAYILVAGQRFGRGVLTQTTLGAILGGATANGVDRLRHGYVVDYVDVHFWPIFNLADACIVVGVAIAVLTFRSGGSGSTPAATPAAGAP